jgi:hypothetical protein
LRIKENAGERRSYYFSIYIYEEVIYRSRQHEPLRIKEKVGERRSYYFSIYIYEERSYIAQGNTNPCE